ncbi:hypothetical protein [Pantoea sp. 18069]|uniref:hypothetical protein n=1 Tax=Pantoea sp. 18069 TaxID=2681415 RepID=UPI0013573344|nr:hypothetical protein [Pantoea sp. 18069]
MKDTPITTDSILLQWTMEASAQAAAAALARIAYSDAFSTAIHRAAGLTTGLAVSRFAWSPTTGRTYVYADLSHRTDITPGSLASVRTAAQSLLSTGPGLTASRLELVFDRHGASHGQTRIAHYTVEMDPADGWMPEIFRWYDEEHMPGLAAVDGNILSRRYLNHDGGPLSLACYDLVTPEVLGCPAWLKVRGSAWSDITRPHFTNTLRTMFSTIDK